MKKIKSSIAFSVISSVIILATIVVVVHFQRTKASYDFLEERINTSNNLRIGSDRDSYGCIASAGYSWCETKNKCLRSWEEECDIISEIDESDESWKAYTNYKVGF